MLKFHKEVEGSRESFQQSRVNKYHKMLLSSASRGASYRFFMYDAMMSKKKKSPVINRNTQAFKVDVEACI